MAILKSPLDVLLVHENISVRNLIQSILRHAGYGFIAVPGEREASRLLACGNLGLKLLIVDRGDGPPSLESPLDRSGPKILYLTAFRSVAERVGDALKHPESGFLSKPFSPKSLLGIVEALIGPPTEGGSGGARPDSRSRETASLSSRR